MLDTNKTIGDLSNVANTTPTNGDSLVWDQSLGTWKPDAVSGGGGGSATFAGLSDTPAAFTSNAGKLLRVNAGATALEFVTAITASEVATISIDALSDVDTTTSAPSTGQVLKWDGAKWAPAADVTSGGGGTDADTLDGAQGAFYLNSGNQNAGFLPKERLNGTYDISISNQSGSTLRLRSSTNSPTGNPSPDEFSTGIIAKSTSDVLTASNAASNVR